MVYMSLLPHLRQVFPLLKVVKGFMLSLASKVQDFFSYCDSNRGVVILLNFALRRALY